MKTEFYGSNQTPQFIDIGNQKIANYTGALISNASGKWKVYPKPDQYIYVMTGKQNLGFSTNELEALKIAELQRETNTIICDNNGLEFPVVLRVEPANENGFIAYFSLK